jgi:hypothetical protein
MSIFERLRNQGEDKPNPCSVRPGHFVLVRRRESVDRCAARFCRAGDFSAMSLTAIALALVILLFGFDSTTATTKEPRHKPEIF